MSTDPNGTGRIPTPLAAPSDVKDAKDAKDATDAADTTEDTDTDTTSQLDPAAALALAATAEKDSREAMQAPFWYYSVFAFALGGLIAVWAIPHSMQWLRIVVELVIVAAEGAALGIFMARHKGIKFNYISHPWLQGILLVAYIGPVIPGLILADRWDGEARCAWMGLGYCIYALIVGWVVEQISRRLKGVALQ
ncbi:MAG: hypothetical protein LBR27_06650 [Bifidobacteriaceae bacterium]|jgi:hypothetical protein|nr:hypothetical protein [Bifidobacteriaceae bacterium]